MNAHSEPTEQTCLFSGFFNREDEPKVREAAEFKFINSEGPFSTTPLCEASRFARWEHPFLWHLVIFVANGLHADHRNVEGPHEFRGAIF